MNVIKYGVPFDTSVKFKYGAYEPRCVFNYLKTFREYKKFVGLDFGDGVCTLYVSHPKDKIESDSGEPRIWVTEKLKVSDKISMDDGVPTAIAYLDEKKRIGKQAGNCDVMFHQFKELPTEWGKTAGKHTYESITKDFLGELWKMVLEENEEIGLDSEKTLVAVGHPGGKLWSDKNNIELYLKMLKEVFAGYSVIVMPEPFAAILGAVRESAELIISNGVYIIEPGSSTTDTCYILPGKRIFTGSVKCAGRDIDKSVYEYLVFSNTEKLNLKPALFDDQSVRKAIWDIKALKELYCSDPDIFDSENNRNSRKKSITINQMVPGSRKPDEKRIDFDLNKELFDKALNYARIEKEAQGERVRVWNKEIKDFLVRDKDSIYTQDGKAVCGKLVLAGGTSNVPHFVNAVKDVFSNETAQNKNLIHNSSNPTQIVAQGLAYGNFVMYRADNVLQEYKSTMEKLCLKDNFNKYAGAIARSIAEVMAAALKAFCDDYLLKNPSDRPWISDYSSLRDFVLKHISPEDIQSLNASVEKTLFEFFKSVQDNLKSNLNDLVDKIYQRKGVVNLADMSPDIFQFNINGRKWLERTVMNFLKDTKYIRSFFSVYEKFAFSNIIIERMKTFESLQRSLSVPSEYEKKLKKATWDIKWDVNMGSDYDLSFYDFISEAIEDQAEIYLGKALLLITE